MLSTVPLNWFLTLSAILFTLGIAGFIIRKNVITVFMSIELMLNAVNLSFVAFSYQFNQVDGHIFSFFVMVVAAAEAAVGAHVSLVQPLTFGGAATRGEEPEPDSAVLPFDDPNQLDLLRTSQKE